MQEIHILFTGVGRRIELLQAFRQAALILNINLKIYGADMEGTAPALAYCDVTRKVCGMKDSDYINQLVNICEDDKIDLVIPTIDTDLLVLSQSVSQFEKVDTKVLISKENKIALCRDKNLTAGFFEQCGLKAPHTYNDYRIYDDVYPCFIKPKDGSSSINAFKVNNAEELQYYAEKIDDYVIQPFIEGTEYTIDIFCDFDGNPVSIVPRERLAVRAGEVLKTQIAKDDVIIREANQLISEFKPCGPMTVQLIRNQKNGDDYYIEINPRFGGGAPLSMKAGARSAESILKLLCGKPVQYSESFNDGAVYSRFDQSVCIDRGKVQEKVQGVIFDLDDTLYSEKEYVKSGYKAVAEYLGDNSYAELMWNYFEQGLPAIDELLKKEKREDEKIEVLNIYRKHNPEIHLYEGIVELIEKLKGEGIKVGIITDGRPEGQRKKINALGLEKLVDDIIVTDELGGMQFRKPNDISFRIIQNRWRISFEQILYVGDNVSKDFQAPKQLGMQTVWFRNKDGLYESIEDDEINQVITDIILLPKYCN